MSYEWLLVSVLLCIAACLLYSYARSRINDEVVEKHNRKEQEKQERQRKHGAWYKEQLAKIEDIPVAKLIVWLDKSKCTGNRLEFYMPMKELDEVPENMYLRFIEWLEAYDIKDSNPFTFDYYSAFNMRGYMKTTTLTKHTLITMDRRVVIGYSIHKHTLTVKKKDKK